MSVFNISTFVSCQNRQRRQSTEQLDIQLTQRHLPVKWQLILFQWVHSSFYLFVLFLYQLFRDSLISSRFSQYTIHPPHIFSWNALHSVRFTCNKLWCVVIFFNKIINSHAAKQLNGAFSLLFVDSSKRLVYTMRVYNLLLWKLYVSSYVQIENDLKQSHTHSEAKDKTISNGKKSHWNRVVRIFHTEIAGKKNHFWLMNCFTSSAPNRWPRRFYNV